MDIKTSHSLLCLQILVLICSCNGVQYVKLFIETSVDEGNRDSDVYLTLLSTTKDEISDEMRLGKFSPGSLRWFAITVHGRADKLECLKFTLSGTDGWTMKMATMVTDDGATYQFFNREMKKLDNTFYWEENSVEFCGKTQGWFNLAPCQENGTYKVQPTAVEKESLLTFNCGTVCSKYFSHSSALAICKELGYQGGASWRTDSSSRGERSNYSIALTRVRNCAPYGEAKWFECSLSTATNLCTHSDDVFLTCGVPEGVSKGVIVGIVAGVAFIVLIALVCFCCKVVIKRGRNEFEAQTQPSAPQLSPEQPRGLTSAPPEYEMVAVERHDAAPPSYDETVANPHHYRSSSFRTLSKYFRGSTK